MKKLPLLIVCGLMASAVPAQAAQPCTELSCGDSIAYGIISRAAAKNGIDLQNIICNPCAGNECVTELANELAEKCTDLSKNPYIYSCVTSDGSLNDYLNELINSIKRGTNTPAVTADPVAAAPDPVAAAPDPVAAAPDPTTAPDPTAAAPRPVRTPRPFPTQSPAKPSPTTEASSGETNKPAQSSSASDIELEVLTLVNKVRAQNGLKALTWADDLANVARAHSRDMINRRFFDHTNPDGASPFDRLRKNGINYRAAAENIAYGQRTPSEVMNAWMNSAGHRANILNSSVKEMGVGAVKNSSGTIYWTQLFVSR